MQLGLASPPVPIPDHTLLRVIGRGSYGEVWLARNVMGTYRAVKIVHRAAFDSDRPYQREFEGIRRCEPVSRAHDGLIDILHMGRPDEGGFFYYVMELADPAGSGLLDPETYEPATLSERLSPGAPLAVTECLRVVDVLAGALAFLHEQALIHRDVKPSNILYIDGVPKLGDIGLVAEAGNRGSFVGTEGFVPHEGPGTERADLFALGKVLYEALTGLDRSQFPLLPTGWRDSDDFEQRVELNEIVLRACEGDRTRSYRSARELLADVALIASGRSARRLHGVERRLRLLKWAASLITLLAVLVGASLLLLHRERSRSLALERARSMESEAKRQAESISLQLRVSNTRLEETLASAELDRAEGLFRSGETGEGLALLARLARRDPTHPVAVPRLAAALWQGNFAMPLMPPWRAGRTVLHLEWLRGGRTLLVCTNHGLTLWEAATGRLLVAGEGESSTSNKAVVSPDQRTVAIWDGMPGRSLQLFDVESAHPLAPPIRHDGMLHRVSFSSDGALFVMAGEDPLLQVRDARTGQLVGELIQQEVGQWDAAFSPDGDTLAVTSAQSVRLWNRRTGTLQLEIPCPGAQTHTLRFSNDGSLLLVARLDGTMRFHSLPDGHAVGAVMPHHDYLRSARFSPDGGRLLTASTDQTARIWSVPGGAPLTPPLRHRDSVNFAAFSPDGEQVVTCGSDTATRVWDARTGRPLTQRLRHFEQPLSAAFTPDGATLCAGGADGIVQRWDLRGIGGATTRVEGSRAGFSPDGTALLTTAPPFLRGTDTFRPLEIEGGVELDSEARLAQFSPDGKLAALASADQIAILSRDDSGWKRTTTIAPGGTITDLAFRADGHCLATASQDGTARVWGVADGMPRTDPLLHDMPVQVVRFAPDGTILMTATQAPPHLSAPRPTAFLWDAVTGQRRGLPMEHLDTVNAAEFSGDGSLLATASHDNTARIWEAPTGRAVSPPLRHTRGVAALAFSPDGRTLATGSWDGTARLWEVPTGAPLARPMWHPDRVLDVRFSPDGRRLATASRDHSVRIWDPASGQPLTEPLLCDAPATRIHFHPDGGRLLVATVPSTLHLFETPAFPPDPPRWLIDLAGLISLEELPATDQGALALIARYQQCRAEALATGSPPVYARLAARLFSRSTPE